MTTRLLVFASICLSPLAASAQTPLDRIAVPTVNQAAAAFRRASGPGAIQWWSFNGEMTNDRIVRELDTLKSEGITHVLLAPDRTTNFKYLSPEFFEAVRFAVQEAGRRGLKVWAADEGSYPSGFAGGKISSDYPELRMQALVIAERIDAAGGQTVARKLAPETVGVVAVNLADRSAKTLPVQSGGLNWTAPEGKWQVLVVQHQFRTAPTRYVHNPTGAKDTTNSIEDYLDVKATRAFMKETHEQYKKYIGSEFGKTFVGFFGDEPDYSIGGIAWTPAIFEEFERVKGYDIRPYAPLFLAPELDEKTKLAKADYWDVWSDLFRDNFFKPQADWCEQNHLVYVVHLNQEDALMNLARTEGDFFKDERYVQVPAVDAIWRQIWMNKVNDFPKLASSVAHLFGRPYSFTESFAVYGRGLSLEQAKWVIEFQYVRGLNLVLSSIFLTRPDAENPQAPEMPLLIRHTNRLSQLLSTGRPAADIALYLPTTSMWLGDAVSYKSTLSIMQGLLERQRDFDLVDEYSLATGMTLEKGVFRNQSGQMYRAVVVPSVTAISKPALERLRKFAASGGRVLFLGRTPSLVNDRTFLGAEGPADLGWAVCEPSGQVNARVLDALPPADVSLDHPSAPVKYLHRKWSDADLYFFFNENAEKQSRQAVLSGKGTPQIWDADSGRIQAIAGTPPGTGYVQVPLALEPYESKLIVVGPLPPGPGGTPAAAEPLLEPGTTLVSLDGDWTLDIAGKQLTTALRPWADLGLPAFSGAAHYRKEFTVPDGALDGKTRFFLDCAEVRYSARAKLNGVDLGDRVWRPFRWDVTKALKPGSNVLEVEVRNTPAPSFAGDPVRQAELKKQAAAETGPPRLSVSLGFDLEMLPSGLLGQVRIAAGQP